MKAHPYKGLPKVNPETDKKNRTVNQTVESRAALTQLCCGARFVMQMMWPVLTVAWLHHHMCLSVCLCVCPCLCLPSYPRFRQHPIVSFDNLLHGNWNLTLADLPQAVRFTGVCTVVVVSCSTSFFNVFRIRLLLPTHHQDFIMSSVITMNLFP